MRLEKRDQIIIKKTILDMFEDAKISLFGSRVDDSKKGGDIDLLVETRKDVAFQDEIKLLSQFETNGIFRKVDLVIDAPNKRNQEFIKSITKRIVL